MPTLDHIAELFKTHLANPSDPQPTLSLIKKADQTVQFLDGFIGSGEVTALEPSAKVQLLAMLGVWCPAEAPKLLERWIAAESDADLLSTLQKRLRTFGHRSQDSIGG